MTVSICPPVLTPLNSTLCYANNQCVESGVHCINTCEDPIPRKCASYNPNTGTTNYYCSQLNSPCTCEQIGKYSCLSTAQLSSSQIDLCTDDPNGILGCIHTDLCLASEPFLCNNYKCVTEQQYCPSVITCPPSYFLCPDNLHCSLSFTECPALLNPKTVCSDKYPLLCPDQIHCSNSINKCPSMITCPSNKYLCPNGQCVTDPYSCKPLNTCGLNLYRCPLGECVNNTKDCPALPTCPDGEKLCENRQCVSIYEECPDIYTELYEYYEDQEIDVFRCPSGDVVFNEYNCPDSIVCPFNQYKCPDSSCISFDQECPQVSACPDGTIWCPSGGCAPSLIFCGMNPSCPITPRGSKFLSRKILGLDLACHWDYNDLSIITACSAERPIRCPNNMCVKDSVFCASMRKCPSDTPVLCEDGRCVVSSQYCRIPDMKTCPEGYYSCPSHTCAPSKSLCPNTVICLPPSISCYDGSCRVFNETQRAIDLGDITSLENCATLIQETYTFSPCTCEDTTTVYCGETCLPVEECPAYEALYSQCINSNKNIIMQMCQDIYDSYPCPAFYHYRSSVITKPFSAYCPPSAPFLCADFSCHSTIAECYIYSTCGFEQVVCNDGTCKNSITECNMPVLCPISKPYKCYDNICVSNPDDCNANIICPTDKPFRCYDNICVKSQLECHALGRCANKNVLCFDYLCHDNSEFDEDSSNYLYTMPTLYENVCDTVTSQNCAHGFTRCRNGACVTSSQYCEDYTCPLYAPYLCPDGSCALSETLCREVCSTPVLCPRYNNEDNTIVYKRICCDNTYINCCYNNYEYANMLPFITCTEGKELCADGICRVSGSCVNADGCTYESPYKCINGDCVADMSTCIQKYSCPSGYYHCPNGRCVESILYCYSESVNTQFCDTIHENTYINEPTLLPIMCADSTCVSTYSQCMSITKCPEDAPYICNNGICTDDLNNCSDVTTCPLDLPIRIQRGLFFGSCVSDSIYSYYESVSICINNFPFLCSNNACQVDANSCINLDLICPLYAPFKCYNGACAKDENSCTNTNNCNILTPYRCRNSYCVTRPEECKMQTASDDDSYLAVTSRKYKCQDGSYEDTFLKCKTLEGCLATTPFKCRDDSCVSMEGRSLIFTCPPITICPTFRPHLCGDGSCSILPEHCPHVQPCRDDQYQCADLMCVDDISQCQYIASSCPIGNPIKCQDGSCVSNGNLCIIGTCSDDKPYLCASGKCVTKPSLCPQYTCTGNSFNCWNGECSDTFELCVALPACPMSRPMRCYDGECVKYPYQCSSRSYPSCPSGQKLCPYGICSSVCSAHFGCQANQYMCSNSTCVTLDSYHYSSLFESSAVCPSKCIGGSCTDRLMYIYNAHYAILLTTQTTLPLPVVYNNHRLILSLEIPERFILHPPLNAVLFIAEVPTSAMSANNYYVHLNNNTALTSLTYEETLLSPILLFDIRDIRNTSEAFYSDIFRLPLVLYYSVDIQEISLADMCIGERNATARIWTCVSTVSLSNNKVTGCINKAGIYALIYSPIYVPPPESSLLFMIIAYCCVFLLFIILIIFFIIVIHYERVYKSQCEQVDTIIKDETSRKQVMINYVYNPLLTDVKLKFSQESDKYNNTDTHLEKYEIKLLRTLEATEAKLKFAIAQLLLKRRKTNNISDH